MEEFYDVEVAGIRRRLPIVQISDKLAVASFVMLGDCELVCAAAAELKNKVPEADWIVTAEAKGIPLAHELAHCLGMSRYIVARKSVKPYMEHPLAVSVNSITTQKEQRLCLDGVDAEHIKGRRCLLVDDVISTGESINAIQKLVEEAGGEIVGKVCIMTEGDPEKHRGEIALGNLPLFPL